MSQKINALFAFLLILVSCRLYAREDFKTCSQKGLVLIYINGVQTSRAVAEETALTTIKENLRSEELDNRVTKIDFVYNPNTFNLKQIPGDNEGKVLDLWECIHLKSRELLSKGIAGLVAGSFGAVKNSRLDEIAGTVVANTLEAHLSNYLLRYETAGAEVIKAQEELTKMTRDYFSDGYKVIHIAHSQGGFIASDVAKKITSGQNDFGNYGKYYGAIFLGTPISYLPSSVENTKFSYLSSFQDVIVGTLNEFRLALKPNINVPVLGEGLSVEGHNIVTTYLSTTRRGADSLGRREPMAFFVRELLEKSIATLDNNDPSCCAGRDGKLWINESGCPGNANSCPGGFIEKGISYDSLNLGLAIRNGASICKSAQFTNGYPVISGNVDLKGKVTLGDSAQIRGGSRFSTPIYLDSLGGVIEMRGQSVVESTEMGSPSLKGDLILDGTTTISGNGSYSGQKMVFPDGFFSPAIIKDSFLLGKNDLKGFYYLEGATIEKATIEGPFGYQYPANSLLAIYGTVNDAEFKGVGGVGLEGNLIKKAKVHGYSVSPDSGGVGVVRTVEGEGTLIKGSVHLDINVKNGAKITGNRILSNFQNSIVFVNGIDKYVDGGNISGGGSVDASNLTGVTISKCYWQVNFSNLNGTVASGGVTITGGIPSNGSFNQPETANCAPTFPEPREVNLIEWPVKDYHKLAPYLQKIELATLRE